MKFVYKAKNKNGVISKGTIEAKNEYQAIMKLKVNHSVILSLKEESSFHRMLHDIKEKTRGAAVSLQTFSQKRKIKELKKQGEQKEQFDDKQMDAIKKIVELELRQKMKEEVVRPEDRVKLEAKVLEESGLYSYKKEMIPTALLKDEKGSSSKSFRKKKIKPKHIIEFTKQLSILLESGIMLQQALFLLHQNFYHPQLRFVIGDIAKQLEKGMFFSEALMEHRRHFSNFYISMIEIGEKTGDLTGILQDLIQYMKRELDTKKEIIKALIYPLSVLSIFFLIIIFMGIFIVPRFQEIFTEMNVELPTITKVVFFVASNMLWISGLLAVLITGITVFCLANKKIRTLVSRFMYWSMYRLVITRKILFSYNMQKISGSLMILLKNGIPFNYSLISVQKMLGDPFVKQDLENIRLEIEQGSTLTEAFSNKAHIDTLFQSSIANAEYAGSLWKSLQTMNGYFKTEMEDRIGNMKKIFEPLTIVVIAIVFIPFIIGIYLPIVKMSNGI